MYTTTVVQCTGALFSSIFLHVGCVVLCRGAPLHHAIKQAVMFAGKLKHGNDVCCFLADFIYALPLLTGDQHNAVSSLCQLYWKIMCGVSLSSLFSAVCVMCTVLTVVHLR